jgi:hypothetical protein
MDSCGICPSVTGLFYLAHFPVGSATLQVAGFPSVVKVNGNPLYVPTTLSLLVHLWVDARVVLHLGYCDKCCNSIVQDLFCSVLAPG